MENMISMVVVAGYITSVQNAEIKTIGFWRYWSIKIQPKWQL